MLLQLKPHDRPLPAADGWLIRGSNVADWLQILGHSGLSLNAMTTYAIPGATPASIWGCLIVGGPQGVKELPSASPVALISGCLFIPEFTALFPAVAEAELKALLREKRYLLHPEAGFVALDQPLFWEDLIAVSQAAALSLTTPANPVFIPAIVRSFEVKAAAPEESIAQLEQSSGPEQKKFEDNPLNVLEKIKLSLYRQLFGKASETKNGGRKKSFLLKKLEAVTGRRSAEGSNRLNRMREDFEDLERRNASEIDKLLELIKNNPEEALKYAIPIGDGTERGGGAGAFQLSQRWSSFSLFGGGGGAQGGGNVSISDDHQMRLMQEYRRMAETLAASGDHEKAAFIYMKLLKEYRTAATTLEAGRRYAEAAAIYLKYCNDKTAAAASYVKGNMLRAAIDIYTELGKDEDAGDLYRKLNEPDAALKCYQKVAEEYAGTMQYLKAAKVRSGKMHDVPGAQELLLQGWRSGRDRYNCLHTFFSNFDEAEGLAMAVRRVYEQDTNAANARDFLNALKSEAERSESLSVLSRDIATELVAAYAQRDASILPELRFFHKKNKLIGKDILRYGNGRR